jgi:hypothetical protein
MGCAIPHTGRRREPERRRERTGGRDRHGSSLGARRAWVPLSTHSTDARDAARQIIDALAIDDLPAGSIIRAAQAHDLGKAHHVFQETMRRGYPGAADQTVWAKSGSRTRHSRRGFRHELASALAWLSKGEGDDRDLVAYLLAAHHGKVRLSLRALPTDQGPPDPRVLHARGVWDGERLPDVSLGDGFVFASTLLRLDPCAWVDTTGSQAGSSASLRSGIAMARSASPIWRRSCARRTCAPACAKKREPCETTTAAWSTSRPSSRR